MLIASLVFLVGLVASLLVLLRSSSRASTDHEAVKRAVAAQVLDAQKRVELLDNHVVERLVESDDGIDEVIRDYHQERGKLCPQGVDLDGPRWKWTGEDLTHWAQEEVVRKTAASTSGENFKIVMRIVVILSASAAIALFVYREASQAPPAPPPAQPPKLPVITPKRP